MRRPAVIFFVGLVAALLFAAYRSGLAQDEGTSLRFWTVAKSKTWDGTPDPRVRYMATVGASELSKGLQLSGFKGSAELSWVKVEPKPGVRRAVTLTALKARIIGVRQKENTIIVQVRPEPRGYELAAVDISNFEVGTTVTVVFKDPSGVKLARDTVVIEQG